MTNAPDESAMSNPPLLMCKDGPLAWLRLNRPDAMNALTATMATLFGEFLTDLASDDDIRVVVITGSGPAFCAGADLREVREGPDTVPGQPDMLDLLCEHIFNPLRDFPKPVIAALNGVTVAGGLELAMCADIVLAVSGAKIGDAHANYGVFPGGGGASLLPRIVPHNVAKYLLMTGRTLSAEQMQQNGFVNQVVAPESLEDSATELALNIAEKSPLALRRMKSVANAAMDGTRDEAIAMEMVELRKHQRSWDFNEGLNAFVEKRKPEFRGK